MTEPVTPSPYGAGVCDDCHKNHGSTLIQPLAQYGKVHACHDCTRQRLTAQLGDSGPQPQTPRRSKALRADKGPGRCTDCQARTPNGHHYDRVTYLCETCERSMLQPLGYALQPVDHDTIAA